MDTNRWTAFLLRMVRHLLVPVTFTRAICRTPARTRLRPDLPPYHLRAPHRLLFYGRWRVLPIHTTYQRDRVRAPFGRSLHVIHVQAVTLRARRNACQHSILPPSLPTTCRLTIPLVSSSLSSSSRNARHARHARPASRARAPRSSPALPWLGLDTCRDQTVASHPHTHAYTQRRDFCKRCPPTHLPYLLPAYRSLVPSRAVGGGLRQRR